MITKKGSTIIVKIKNFMSPGAGLLVLGRGHGSHAVKMHYSFKNCPLYPYEEIRQTNFFVIMTKEG